MVKKTKKQKRKRIIVYNFYYQEVEERSNYDVAKENIEHIYSEIEREINNH
jgi:hypothetical protein